MKLFGFLEVISPETLAYFDSLIGPTAGRGRSSGKYGYVLTITAGVFSASFMTLVGTVACARKDIAGDAAFWGVFWGGNTGLWGLIIKFVSDVKRHQATLTKELAMGENSDDDPPPTDTTVTETLTASKAT